jgi:hypothetical protein
LVIPGRVNEYDVPAAGGLDVLNPLLTVITLLDELIVKLGVVGKLIKDAA